MLFGGWTGIERRRLPNYSVWPPSRLATSALASVAAALPRRPPVTCVRALVAVTLGVAAVSFAVVVAAPMWVVAAATLLPVRPWPTAS